MIKVKGIGVGEVADGLSVTEKVRGTGDIWKYSLESCVGRMLWINLHKKVYWQDSNPLIQVYMCVCLPNLTSFLKTETIFIHLGCNKISRRSLHQSPSLNVVTFNSPSFLTVLIARKNSSQ